MKYRVFLALFLVLSKGAIASITKINYSDNKHVLDEIVKIAELDKSALKLAYVFRYNASRFSEEVVAADIRNDYEAKMKKENKLCSYKIVVGSRENIAALRSDNINKDLSAKIAAQLEDLDDRGQLKSIVSTLWDGKNGTPASCSSYEFNAFSVDGYQLVLEFK